MRKLKSENGATLLIALAFMLVCMLIAIVVATASTTASEQVDTTKKQLQAYLTVSSTAEYFEKELEGTTFEYKKTRSGKGYNDPVYLLNTSANTNALFENLLKTAFSSAYPEDETTVGKENTCTLSGNKVHVDNDNIGDVTVDLKLVSRITKSTQTSISVGGDDHPGRPSWQNEPQQTQPETVYLRTIEFTFYADFYLSDEDADYNNFINLSATGTITEKLNSGSTDRFDRGDGGWNSIYSAKPMTFQSIEVKKGKSGLIQ